MEEWKKYKLGEIAVIKGGKRLPKGIELISIPNSHPYIRIRDMYVNKIMELNGDFEYVDDVTQKSIQRYIVKQNDIILAIVGNTLGLVSMVGKSLDSANLTENCVKIVSDNLTTQNYIYYYLNSDFGQNEIKKGIVGAAQPKLPIKNIMDISIALPPLKYQKAVIDVLSSIDDKIELNCRINDNLEQQAQALFKSWFVEKPNPQWTKGSLSDIASFVGGYSYKGDELVDSSNTGMATIKNYNRSGGFKTDGFKAINPSDKVKNAQYAELFEILVAHTDLTQNAEVIGNAELVLSLGEYNKIIFSMDLVKVLPSSSFPYRFLIAAMLKNKLFKGHCQGYVNGTTVLHLNKKALPEYKVMIPTDTEAKKMNEILGGYYKRMSENLKENDMLEQLRDTILPKLMSGELKINDLNC